MIVIKIHACLSGKPADRVERQADDVGERACDRLDEPRRPSLDGIRPRLVERLSRLDVGGNRFVRHRGKEDARRLDIREDLVSADPGNARRDLVFPARQCLEHRLCLLRIMRLAIHPAVEEDDGVGTEHGMPGIFLRHSLCLADGVFHYDLSRCQIAASHFLHRSDLHLKAGVDLLQEFPAARRRRCQNKHDILPFPSLTIPQ